MTMTLIFEISVILICFGAKLRRFVSLNFDFFVTIFDTMIRSSLAKVPESLVPSGF